MSYFVDSVGCRIIRHDSIESASIEPPKCSHPFIVLRTLSGQRHRIDLGWADEWVRKVYRRLMTWMRSSGDEDFDLRTAVAEVHAESEALPY